uniref:Zinc finger n=1 Tax=Nothobranchius furzeri TaxID=105023 RepID=A0A1A8UF59_NOTFU
MQNLLQEHPETNPPVTSATEKLQDTEAEPVQSEPDPQEEKRPYATAETKATPETSRTAEPPTGMGVIPPVEGEPGVKSQAESRDTTSKLDAPTEPGPNVKTNPGCDDRQLMKKPDKGVGQGKKFVLSKKAMVDPLKMDMSKPLVMPLTSAQLSLQCIECHIIFSDHKSKERHLKLSHPAEYEQCILRNSFFACYVCDRHFPNSTELMVHQKAHTEKKPFKCPICSLSFKKLSELTVHKKVHFGEDGYACTECGKTCKTLTLLKYHQRKHTGDKPYVCKECGKRFVMGKALQQHMVSHLPEGAEETSAEVRPKAQKKKSDAIYPCPHCRKVFKTSKTRNLHVTNIHKLPAFVDEQRLKHGAPIITPISISQPSMLQVEPNGLLQKVDANIDTEQIRKLIESLGNVQKVNQVVILGQVPPHAPPLEIHHPSEPAELANLNLSPPQIDFIGLKETESNRADLDPSVDPMEQTIILEPITPDGHLENPSFSDLGSHLTVGENIELTLVETEQTERPQGEVLHQIPKQPETTTHAEPIVCQNEVDDLNQNLEQTVILELTPALMLTEEPEQFQTKPQSEITTSTFVLNADQGPPDQTACQSAVDELETILTAPSCMPTDDLEKTFQHSEQKELSSCLSLPYVQVPSKSETIKEDSHMEVVGIDQGPEQDKKSQDCEKQHLLEKLPVKSKNQSEEKDPSAKEGELLESETKEAPQNTELPINVMSAQELVKVRKRKPARTFFFQGYMHDLVSSIYNDDYQFDAKPAKRQRPKKSHIVVKFGPQNKDKKSKKPKTPPQNQPIQQDLTKVKTSPKKLSKKKVQTQKKKATGKKEKKEGNVLTGREVKSSSPAQQAQQIKDSPSKNKMKKQKVAKESTAHTSEHKTVSSPMFKKKKQVKLLRKDQPKSKKTGKGKKNLAKEQVGKSEEPGSNVNQDSLLLLKGHKQPQLKVYKLDPSKASSQTPETSPQSSQKVSRAKKPSDNFTAEGKKKGGRSKKNQKALSLLSSKKVSNQPQTVPTKPKTTRKRKSSSNVETEGVITSKRALECKDCGESFSEVSSFQKHKTSAHIVESPRLTYTNGNIFEGVSTLDLYQLPQGHDKIVRVMSAPTDWDTEPETALEDRERSVSFPALIPSPSLPVPPTDTEMATYEDGSGGKIGMNDQSHLRLEVQSPFNEIKSKDTQPNPTPETPFSASIHTKGSKTGEPLGSGRDKQEDNSAENLISEFEMQGTTEEDVKEDLLLEVDLVTVGEQNERDDPVSHPEGVNQNESNEDSSPAEHPGQVNHETPESCLTSQTVSCSTREVEVKEEEEETLVQKKKEVGQGVSTRGHQRRDGTSNTSSAEDKPRDVESENEQDDCQVVFEKHCPSSDLETANSGMGTQNSNLNALKSTPVPSLPYTPVRIEEFPEKPVVFELESLSTSVDEVMKGEEHERESDQSPGNILERFLTSRQQGASDKGMCLMTERSDQRRTSDSFAENEVQVLEDPDIKVEESNLQPFLVMPTCQNLQSNIVQPEHHRSIRSVLVKEESRSLLNCPQGGRHMRWNLEPAGNENADVPLIESMETTSSCRLTPELNSNQCIFFPVKEEEREVLLGSFRASRGSSTPDRSSNLNQTADCEPYEKRPSPPNSSQETIVGGPLSDPGSGDVTEGQAASDSDGQSPPELWDFLLQNSDDEDTNGFELSEPQLDQEAEILDFFNQNQMSSEHPNQISTNLPTSADQQQSPSAENRTREPIDYFYQYFGWDTWVKIAASTNKLPNILNPVTYREVACFVGIHIAMGTLKFPSPRLYWDDPTKVLLISEAMSLTRFLDLSRMLKLTSPRDDLTSSCPKSQQHGKTCLSDQSVTSQSQDGQHEGDISNRLQKQRDPLWKVQPLLCRFNAGCQWLRRQGDYAVDQYSLPLMGKIHGNSPSLQCTTLTGLGGFLTHVDLKVDLSDKEDAVEKMVPRGSMIFLCKQELSTPSMLERLLAAGVHGAGKVGGPRGQIGDEFVSSNGKLMLRRSHCGFLLSTAGNEHRNMAALINSFEKAQTLARLSRNLQGLYSTPLTASSPTCWPLAVLWYLTDAALVNSWLLYRQNHRAASAALTFMAFRLEVSKALIHSSSSDTHDSVPPQPPSEKSHKACETPNPVLVEESPLPDAATRYDSSGHWPEQLSEGEGGKCRFGDCQRMSRVLCLKCCVFLCISRNHNCFLNFHSQGTLGKE